MQLQGRPLAVVLDVLAAVERMRHQFLQHLGAELPILDAETEVFLRGRSHVYLTGQVVFHDGLGGVFEALELATDVSRREPAVAVDVDQVNVGFRVACGTTLIYFLQFLCFI